MNKKICLVAVLFFAASLVSAQKKSSKADGKYLLLGVSYSTPKRTEFDKYVSVMFRTGKNELEVGVSIAKTLSFKQSNSTNSAYASVNNNNFDIHFGYNNFLSNTVFWGFDLGALSNNGKIDYDGITTTYFESTPESSNPFKGYQFIFRPKFGFKFKLGEQTSFRLNGFYDLGLSKYEFYTNDIFSSRLKNYKGDTKSSYNNLGLQFSFVVLW